MQPELIRTYHAHGTIGAILLNGEKICAAIELPWKNNQSRISCIPEGRFELKKRYSPWFGSHLLVKDDPGRQWILIHPASNAITQLMGCFAPVTELTEIAKGTQSRKALQKLEALVYHVLENQLPVFLTIKTRSI